MTLDELLAQVRELVGRLAEQQAMTDNWWQERLDELLAAIKEVAA